MIRMLGIEGVMLDDFQEEFNLERKTKDHENEIKNNFESVANAVMQQYPQVKIIHGKFNGEPGRKKVAKLEELINASIPCLISISFPTKLREENKPLEIGYHIVPVIYIDSQKIRAIWVVEPTGNPIIHEFPKEELIRRHEQWPGGDDIAWMEKA